MTVTMPDGLLRYGQAGSYDAIDDRSVITALAGGRKGLVQAPTLAAAAGLVVNLGPWLALVDAGDGTTAVIGDRTARQIPVLAGGASARTETLWADINPQAATWGPLQILGAPALVGRAGLALGTVVTPVNANAASALTLTPARPLPPVGRVIIVKPTDTGRNTLPVSLDPDFQYPLEANSAYSFELRWRYRGGNAGEHMDINFTTPGGVVGSFDIAYYTTAIAFAFQTFNFGQEGSLVAGTNGTNNYRPVWIRGGIRTTNAGVFGLRWGPRVATNTQTWIYAGAVMAIDKQ
jgi:hypothetical protein